MQTLPVNGVRKVIAFDCDDSLVEFNRKLVEFYNRRHGTHFEWEQMTTYEIHLVYQCTEEYLTEVVWEFYHSDDHAAMEAMEGAMELMAYLATRQDVEKHVVTSRVEELHTVTTGLLHGHFGEVFEKYHFANHYGAKPEHVQRTKAEICLEIGAVVLIDDALHHARAVAAAGITVLLPDRPWNQGEIPSGVIRMRDLHEVCIWVKENV